MLKSVFFFYEQVGHRWQLKNFSQSKEWELKGISDLFIMLKSTKQRIYLTSYSLLSQLTLL